MRVRGPKTLKVNTAMAAALHHSKPTLPQSELLKEIALALNLIPNRGYKGGVYKDTYGLVAELERHLKIDNASNKPALIKRARELYEHDECEIDDDARLSPAPPEGTWVQAWVWVPRR